MKTNGARTRALRIVVALAAAFSATTVPAEEPKAPAAKPAPNAPGAAAEPKANAPGVPAQPQAPVLKPRPDAPSVPVGGAPKAFKSGPGQEMQFSFTAKKGASVLATIDGLANSPDDKGYTMVAATKPDASPLAGSACRTKPGPDDPPDFVPPCKLSLADVGEAGRYTLFVMPPPGVTASGRIVLTDFTAHELVPGKPVKIAAMKPTQAARFMFKGEQGQQLDVGLTGIKTSPAGAMVTLALQQVEGGRFNSTMSGIKGSITMPTADLRTSGKYVVIVDAGNAAIESAELHVTPGKK